MAENESFYFDPTSTGLQVFLGSTEAEIMEVLWKRGPLTAKRVQLFLDERTPRAYTTIVTILSNLVDKQLLTKERSGRQFVFTPVGTKVAFVDTRVKRVLACLQRSFPNNLK